MTRRPLPGNRGWNEPAVESLLERAGVAFTRPEADPRDPATTDFKVTDLGLHIECKWRHPGNLRRKIRNTRRDSTIVVLFGPNAARDLLRLSRMLARAPD